MENLAFSATQSLETNNIRKLEMQYDLQYGKENVENIENRKTKVEIRSGLCEIGNLQCVPSI